MALSREAFLQPAEVPTERVYIKSLNDHVIVKGMTAKERADWERQFTLPSGKPNRQRQQQLRERLAIACCVDDVGQKLFTDDDIEMLGNQPAAVLEPIVDAATRCCGLAAAEVEALAKNSDSTDAST